MPLTFNSLSHGKVAFGFFNIESDMLLLENYFFFSTVFCEHMSRIAREPEDEPIPTSYPGYTIDNPEDIGDLMGAIHGIRYTGFIGDLYRQFPFPDDPLDFKQNPKGTRSQDLVKTLIANYARQTEIPFIQDHASSKIALGEYRFDRTSFHQLIEYVWKGGYPRWKEGIRPDHVINMKNLISRSRNKLFEGMVFKT